MIQTPELDKLEAVREKSQAIGEFLDWLMDEKGLILASPHEHDDGCTKRERRVEGEYLPARVSTEQLLAEFFEIDLAKVEQERRALLEEIRKTER